MMIRILREKNMPKLGAYAKGFTITAGWKPDSIEMFDASNLTSPPRHFGVDDEILDATAVISAERLLKLMELEGQGNDGGAFWASQFISVLISHTRSLETFIMDSEIKLNAILFEDLGGCQHLRKLRLDLIQPTPMMRNPGDLDESECQNTRHRSRHSEIVP
jgi:hypothetical protein